MAMWLRQAITVIAASMVAVNVGIQQPKLIHWKAGCGTFNPIRTLTREPTTHEKAVGCLYNIVDVSAFRPGTLQGEP